MKKLLCVMLALMMALCALPALADVAADVEAGLKWAYNVSTNEVQTAFSALKESVSPYSDLLL